jgi:hypothetical protein
MQKGQEPLRSFSDLMQFYELQRPEPQTAVNAVSVNPAVNQAATPAAAAPAVAEPTPAAQPAPAPDRPSESTTTE